MMMDMNDPDIVSKALGAFQKTLELDPFFYRAYVGNDPAVMSKLLAFLQKVDPFINVAKRDTIGFTKFAEGCEEMELYPIAAHSRLKLSLVDPENAAQHMDKFFELIEKCGCKEADELKKMFELSGAIKRKDTP